MSQNAKRKALAFIFAPLWFLLIAFLTILGALPYQLRCRCGGFLGILIMKMKPKRFQVALTNIKRCFPEKSPSCHQEMARKHFRSLGICIIETGFAWGVASLRLRSKMIVEGLEHLHSAQSEGQGVLLMSAHTASLDLMGVALAQAGLKYHAMVRRQKNEFINWFAKKIRRRYACSVFYQGEQMRCCRLLRKGERLVYFPDQDYGERHSLFVPFFGMPAATVVATEKMAKIGQASIVPVFFFRDELQKAYRLIFFPAIEQRSSTQEEVLLACNQAIEAGVTMYPEQYLWAHKRFKSVPQGSDPVYNDY